MKTTMKKWMLTLVCLLFIGTANAGNDKPIRLRQMPVAAQQLIKKNFNGRRVALAKAESKSYEVVFTNGDKVEFDRDGRWKEISCGNYFQQKFSGNGYRPVNRRTTT